MTAINTTRVTLLAKLRSGADAESWSRFDATYREMLVRYCRTRGVQPADADDVVQAVFLRLVQGLRNFEYDAAKGRFRSYLYRCVQTALIDRRRSAAKRDAIVLGDPDAFAASDAEPPEWEREWMDHHYRLALAEVKRDVDAKSVTVFEELLVGPTVRAVAERMQLTEPAVYKVQQRVRERLRDQIVRQIREEDGYDA